MIGKGFSIAILLVLVVARSSFAEEGEAGAEPRQASLLEVFGGKVPTPTWGGSQFWGDVHIFHDWRIQRRVDSDEYRLLGPKEFSHVDGSFDQCLAKLQKIQRDQNLQPMRGRAVVILHGLAATRWTMRLLAGHLEEDGGYTVVNVEYPSTRQPMADHAKWLGQVVAGLPEVEELNFIGHSMGNIVIRHYLADMQKQYGRQDPRLGRVVMIAPPNHGSLTATRLSNNSAFKTILGKPGVQLGAESTWLESDLATPPCQFGIIAGGRGSGGFSFMVPGNDDGRIAVETTRLVGARDFVMVPMIHELIANDPRTFGYVLEFLDEGHFVAADQRQPILEQTPAQLATQPGARQPAEVTRRNQTPGGPRGANLR